MSCALPCNNFVRSFAGAIDVDTYTSRIDHNLGDADRLFGQFVYQNDNGLNPRFIPLSGSTGIQNSRLAGLQWTHVFSSRSLNELRTGFSRQRFLNTFETSFGPTTYWKEAGLKNLVDTPLNRALPQIIPGTGYSSLGASGSVPFHTVANTVHFVDAVTLTRGRNSIKFGADFRRHLDRRESGDAGAGWMWFLGGYTARNPVISQSAGQRDTGNGIADFLLGYPNQAGSRALQFRSIPLSVARLRYHEYGLYLQEDFRVHPQLTLNLGLRWEYRPPMRDKTGGGNVFDFDYPGGRRLYRDRAYTELFNNPIIAACCAQDTLVDPNYHDFAPRVGIAWRPLAGNNRFVVRTGYGISYDLQHTYYAAAALLENIPIVSPTLPLPTGVETQPPLDIRNLFPAAYSVAEQKFPPPYCQAPSHSIVDPTTGVASVVLDFCSGGGGLANNRTPYTQQWGLNLQYEPVPNLLVEVGYQGSQGIRLPIMWAFNQAVLPAEAGNANNSVLFRSQCPPGTYPNRCSPVQDRVFYANFSASSSVISNRMQAIYHGLVLKADKRFSHGLQILASFTWSRAIDQASEIQDVSGGSAAAQYAHRLDLERGLASFDQTRRFHFSWLYELPFGKGQQWLNRGGVANRFVGGWQVNGILKLADGTPFTVGCNCGDRQQVGNTSGTSNRMNAIQDPLPSGFQQTYERWFDTSAFATPPLGTLGNSGRNTLRTPGQRATDLSVFKNNLIGERTNIQFRAEFTNLFSGHFYSPVFPSLNATSANFGSMLPVGGDHGNLFNPRIIQLALRVVF